MRKCPCCRKSLGLKPFILAGLAKGNAVICPHCNRAISKTLDNYGAVALLIATIVGLPYYWIETSIYDFLVVCLLTVLAGLAWLYFFLPLEDQAQDV